MKLQQSGSPSGGIHRHLLLFIDCTGKSNMYFQKTGSLAAKMELPVRWLSLEQVLSIHQILKKKKIFIWLWRSDLQIKHKPKKDLRAVDCLFGTFGRSEVGQIQVQDIGTSSWIFLKYPIKVWRPWFSEKLPRRRSCRKIIPALHTEMAITCH